MTERIYDEIKFNEKYDKYYKLVYHTAYQYLFNVESAEDITQDVFVKLLTYQKNFTEEEHEKAWLLRVTINLCKNTLKSKAFHNLELNDKVKTEEFSFEEKTNQKIDIANELKRLTPEQRIAIHLFYYEDYSIADISRVMNTKENTVKSYLRRAKQNLKINIEQGV